MRDAQNRLKFTNNNDEDTRFIELKLEGKRLIKQSKRSTEFHLANQNKGNQKVFSSFIKQKSKYLNFRTYFR